MQKFDIKNSPLEKWLRNRNMTSKEFCEKVGCSRPVVGKVKKLLPISEKYAKKIHEVTQGEISPKIEKVGGRR